MAASAAPALGQSIEQISETDPATATDESVELGAGQQVFEPAFFDRFAPRSAFDMVVQIPGFQIRGDNNGSRGFGQASGNVLINGQRISGKSNGAVDTLNRIAVDIVVRIELLDGASLDIPGLSGQVVNVVTAPQGITGTWSYDAVIREMGNSKFTGAEITAAGKTGDWEWAISLGNDPFVGLGFGPEIVLDGTGNVIDTRDETVVFLNERPNFSGNLVWKGKNGHIANINGQISYRDFQIEEISNRFPVDGADNVRLFDRLENTLFGEVSADYAFPVGPGQLKLIGLFSGEERPGTSAISTTFADGSPEEASQFDQKSVSLEGIARTEYSWAPKSGRDWQLSLEGAFNSLDIESAFFTLNDAGVLVEEGLDGATTVVEELRGEVNVTHGRQITPNINTQISLGGEVSQISQSGPSGLTRTFFRPKGFVSASWAAKPWLDVTARVERQVGQLNFGDFVSSVNLNNENDTFGNPDLVPSQTWRGELQFETRLGDWGATTLLIYGESISDVIDRAPVSETEDAVANIGNATRVGARINATLRLDPLGLKGVQLDVDARARNTSLTDPLTGETRRIGRNLVSRIGVDLRWDIPETDYAITVDYNQERRGRQFRIDEISIDNATPGRLGVSVEHKDLFGATGFIRVASLLDETDRFDRTVFVGNRFGPVDFVEQRDRSNGLIFRFGINANF
ncbi:MAG: TonB-dependent receptor plug domain-containing protein [Pseudomonadota bacterium]